MAKKNGPRIEIQGRVLNPISYEKPALLFQAGCQKQNPLPARVLAIGGIKFVSNWECKSLFD
jgi:hypothetical protein